MRKPSEESLGRLNKQLSDEAGVTAPPAGTALGTRKREETLRAKVLTESSREQEQMPEPTARLARRSGMATDRYAFNEPASSSGPQGQAAQTGPADQTKPAASQPGQKAAEAKVAQNPDMSQPAMAAYYSSLSRSTSNGQPVQKKGMDVGAKALEANKAKDNAAGLGGPVTLGQATAGGGMGGGMGMGGRGLAAGKPSEPASRLALADSANSRRMPELAQEVQAHSRTATTAPARSHEYRAKAPLIVGQGGPTTGIDSASIAANSSAGDRLNKAKTPFGAAGQPAQSGMDLGQQAGGGRGQGDQTKGPAAKPQAEMDKLNAQQNQIPVEDLRAVKEDEAKSPAAPPAVVPAAAVPPVMLAERIDAMPAPPPATLPTPPPVGPNREAFQPITDNPFVRTLEAPQSTFGIDVDTASYAIVRRYLASQNLLPPRDAVRIEEMVNAFQYEYPQPEEGRPFSVNLEIARCPWNAQHRLARIGLQGRSIDNAHRPPGNIVFLIDVSGSMGEPDKLPLLKTGMRMLTEQLVEGDRVTIVTYATNAQVALDTTSGERKGEILAALDALQAGGSTNGAGGIELAYQMADRNFQPEGTNRVVLATDGDFNVGMTARGDLERLITEKAKHKIHLTVLGFGRGNLQDDRLMALADKGDGQYHYIDSEAEARKVLVEQVAGTLVTIAKDVKLQVDFNPAKVAAYRLLGYEKRALAAQDFKDDAKDSGDLGAGHTVTAFYELVPPGVEVAEPAAEPSRFVKPAQPANPEAKESFVVKLRYKAPKGDVSQALEVPAIDEGRDYAVASPDFKFAAAVASFGLLLRDSPYKGTATFDGVLELAEASKGSDSRGERAAFLDLVRKARELRSP